MEEVLKGKVAFVLDPCTIVIDKGSEDGIKEGQRFLIFYNGDEIIDPDTKKSLGILEIICGEGKIKHIQENMTTLESENIGHSTKKRTSNNMMRMFGESDEYVEQINIPIPFENVTVGCLFKQIK